MPLPKAVQRQLDAAEAAEAELHNQAADHEEGSDTQGVDPAGEQDDQEQGAEQEAPPPKKRTDWKNKYLTLEGKYRAEVPVLIQKVRELEAKLEEAEKAKSEQPQSSSDLMGLFTPEQREEFGDDLLQVVAETARKIAAKETAPVKEQAETASMTTEQLREMSYETQLDAATEGKWRQLDTDPGFIEWLHANEDPYTGESLFEVINRHHAQMNAPVVARIFNQYMQRQPGTRSKQERVAQPAAHRASGPPAQGRTEGRVFKDSEVRRIYNRFALGKIPAEEFKALEQEIEQAAREGRIIPG